MHVVKKNNRPRMNANKRKSAPALFFVALSVACTTVPDKRDHSISCAGEEPGWSNCEKQASDLCADKGYEVVGKRVNYFSSKVVSRGMEIRCKE